METTPLFFRALSIVSAVALCAALSPVPVRSRPAGPDSLLTAARAAYTDGAYDRVIAILQSSVPARKGAEADYYVGASFAALNDPRNALRYLRAAVDSAPGEISYRFQLAKAFAAAGMPAEARGHYSRLLAADSAFLPALFNLGTLCFDARDYRASVEPPTGHFRRRSVRQNCRERLLERHGPSAEQPYCRR